MKSKFLGFRYFFFDFLFFSFFFNSFLFFYEIMPLSDIFLVRKELLKFSVRISLVFNSQLIFNLFSFNSFFDFLKPVSFVVFSDIFSAILDFHLFLKEKFVFFLLGICFKGFFINISVFENVFFNKDINKLFTFYCSFFFGFSFFFSNFSRFLF